MITEERLREIATILAHKIASDALANQSVLSVDHLVHTFDDLQPKTWPEFRDICRRIVELVHSGEVSVTIPADFDPARLAGTPAPGASGSEDGAASGTEAVEAPRYPREIALMRDEDRGTAVTSTCGGCGEQISPLGLGGLGVGYVTDLGLRCSACCGPRKAA